MGCDCNNRTALPNLGPCSEEKFWQARLLDCGCGNVLVPNTSPNGCPPQEPALFNMRFFQGGIEVQTVRALANPLAVGYPSAVEIKFEEADTSLSFAITHGTTSIPLTFTLDTPLSYAGTVGETGTTNPGDTATILLTIYDNATTAVQSAAAVVRKMPILYI